MHKMNPMLMKNPIFDKVKYSSLTTEIRLNTLNYGAFQRTRA